MTTEPLSFDPAQAEEGTRLPFYQGVYDTLLLRKPNGDLAPMLAKSWKVADDALSITLELRDDVTFQDGTKFDSSVVKTNMERFKNQNGPQASTLGAMKEVQTPDEHTAVIELSQPDPAMPVYLSNAAGLMGSPKSFSDPSLKSTPAGSGPYQLDASNTSVGVKYTYTSNEKYWGAKLPYDKIVFTVLPDEQAQLNALRSGQINTTVFFTAAAGQEAKNAGFTHHPVENDYQGIVMFDRNGAKIPALADVRVRQAINYAIDRKRLLSTFALDQGSVTEQIWGTNSDGYDKSLDEAYSYDPVKAKKLLAEAGYANGFDLPMPTVNKFDPALMAAIMQMLNDVGIKATTTDVPFANFFTQLRDGTWPASYMRFFQPGDWQLINQFIAPDASWNSFHTTDPKVGELIKQIQVASADKAKAPSQELNKYIVEQAWFAPFFRMSQQLFTDSKTTVEPQGQQGAPSIYNYAPKN